MSPIPRPKIAGRLDRNADCEQDLPWQKVGLRTLCCTLCLVVERTLYSCFFTVARNRRTHVLEVARTRWLATIVAHARLRWEPRHGHMPSFPYLNALCAVGRPKCPPSHLSSHGACMRCDSSSSPAPIGASEALLGPEISFCMFNASFLSSCCPPRHPCHGCGESWLTHTCYCS